jgi:hypothetical protein
MDLHRMIANRAYELWVQRGRPHGSQEEDWLEAERQLAGEQPPIPKSSDSAHRDSSLAASFPASDPPASRIPDAPPVNASAKWEAARNKEGAQGTKPSKDAQKNPESATRRPVDESDDAPPTAPRDIGEG